MSDPDKVEQLEQEIEYLQREIERLELRLRMAATTERSLRETIRRDLDNRRSERELLVDWLDRRKEQQIQAMAIRNLSEEAKGNIELELDLIARYREIIIKGKHVPGSFVLEGAK
jgi:TolA-binding protein